MTEKPRIVLASIWAPLAVLLFPAILTLAAMGPSPVPEDDAPGRAAIILMFLMPFAYPFLGLFMATAGYVLLAIGKLTLRNLMIGCGFLSLATGAMFGLQRPFGVEDQLIGFGIFSFSTMLSLSLGMVCWWYLAHWGQTNPLTKKRMKTHNR